MNLNSAREPLFRESGGAIGGGPSVEADASVAPRSLRERRRERKCRGKAEHHGGDQPRPPEEGAGDGGSPGTQRQPLLADERRDLVVEEAGYAMARERAMALILAPRSLRVGLCHAKRSMTDVAFVDTNVLIYAHDAASTRSRAEATLRNLWESGIGRLSAQVPQEFCVSVTRRLASPVARATAREFVATDSARVRQPTIPATVTRAIDIADLAKISS